VKHIVLLRQKKGKITPWPTHSREAQAQSSRQPPSLRSLSLSSSRLPRPHIARAAVHGSGCARLPCPRHTPSPAWPCRPRPLLSVALHHFFPISPLDCPSMSPHLGPSAGGGRASFSPHSVYDRQQPRPTNSPSRTRALPPAPASPVSTRPPGLLARPRSGIEVSTPVGRWRVASEVAVRESNGAVKVGVARGES
jgi:hypothetical protein